MEREEQKNIQDLVNSVSLYVAKETGVLKSEYSDRQIGVMGAYNTDILDTAQRFKRGEITLEEARQEVSQASERALIAAAVAEIYDFVADKVVNFVRAKIPMLTPIAETAVATLREPVVELATNVITGVLNTVASWVRSLAKIFG